MTKTTPLNQDNRVRAILVRHAIHTDEDLTSDFKCIDELYEEFVNSGVMPYGVAKARTGDPMEWIIERVRPILELERLVDIAFEVDR